MKTIRLDSIESTQRYARDLLCAGEVHEPTVVIAREQSGGIGRFGRVWASPPGGLWLTLIVPRCIELEPWFSLRLALVVRSLCERLVPASAGRLLIKWPNDVMLNDRKVAGLLIEQVVAKKERWLLIGVGLNVCVERAALAESVRAVAASLCEVGATPAVYVELERELPRTLLEASQRVGTSKELEMIEQGLWGREQQIWITRPDGHRVIGEVLGLETNGALRARIEGRIETMVSVDRLEKPMAE